MLKFQTSLVDGKPRIFVEKESVVHERHTFGYKQREQRFSLRQSNNKVSIATSSALKKPWGANAASKQVAGGSENAKKGVSKPVVAKQKLKKSDVNCVTLTQEQLSAILASVGQINNDRRNVGVDITLDTKKNKIDIKARRRNALDEELSDDRDSALGEDSDYTSSPREDKSHQLKNAALTEKKKSKKQANSKGENVMSLLKSDDAEDADDSNNWKKHESKTSIFKAKETSEERMRRLIEENIDKLSEEDLIDLLAGVYMEEQRLDLKAAEQMDMKTKSLKKSISAGSFSESKKVRGIRKSDVQNVDEEASRGPGKVTRWAADVDSAKSKGKATKNRRNDVGKKLVDENRSPSISNQEEEITIGKRKKENKRNKRNDDSDGGHEPVEQKSTSATTQDMENKEVVSAAVVSVANLSTAEKMKLKWAQERAELTKLAQQSFDPWGRPGCGAPLSPRKDIAPNNQVTTTQQQQSVVHDEKNSQVKAKPSEERIAPAPSNVPGLHLESLNSSLNAAIRDPNQPFLRGGGLDLMHADAKTLAELEDKRRRQQEHQEAVRQQVEERARQRSAERRRRLVEEAEEERRISLEHNSMTRQFETDHERIQRKKNEEDQRLAQLNETFLAAEQRAREEKVARRLRQLERGGHDTTALRANLTARSLDNLIQHPVSLMTDNAALVSDRRSVERFSPVVQPKQIAVQTEMTSLMVDRERGDGRPPVPHTQRTNGAAKTRSDSRFKEHVHTHLPLELDRHTAEAFDTQRSHDNDTERPGWNERRPLKRATKQSERDPNYQRNRLERDARRRQRHNFLLTQIDPLTGRIADVNTQDRRSQSPLINTIRVLSPPVPAVRHKLEDEKFYHPSIESNSLPAGEFLRTFDVLDPGVAAQPLPVSRENTARMAARKAYIQGLNPAHFGKQMEPLNDRRIEKTLPQRNNKDPIFNPGLVRDQPTVRQDAILAQLSNIRKGLLMRQKEIENSLTQNDNF